MDAMGANFINASLECMADYLKQQAELRGMMDKLEIVMSILSNYTPQCLVECLVTCSVEKLSHPPSGMTGEVFAQRFNTAILMAGHDMSRAVTNNKGIYNGIDAVLIATGNDFRAVEAAGHAFASRDGNYKGLTHTEIRAGKFTCILEMPIPLGVVGGLTKLHPLAQASLQLLGNPGAETLMSIAASVGMANHYSAIKALITGGIQHGHMRLHLVNLLNQLGASKPEKELAIQHFTNTGFTYTNLRAFIDEQRKSDKAEEK
jgi:hydroxymethylglutaryl-CoA reductase